MDRLITLKLKQERKELKSRHALESMDGLKTDSKRNPKLQVPIKME